MSRYYITSTVFLVLFIGSLSLDGTVAVPVWWYSVLFGIYVLIVAVGVVRVKASFFVKIRNQGNGNAIALTFDDGPIPGKTEKILQILKEYKIEGAFFCIGHRIDACPLLVKRMSDEGHLIANHSYWHGRFFSLKNSGRIAKELFDADTAIIRSIGKRPKFFRPPYGVTNPMVAKALRRSNHTVIGWSIRSFDTVIKDPDKLFRRVTRSLQGGDIILFHDYSDSMLTILPRVLDHIEKLGLKVVRVDRLLNEKAYV